MKRNLIVVLALSFLFAAPLRAENPVAELAARKPAADPLAGNGNPYSDPVFQDFVETSDGYLKASNTPKLRGDYRDSLNSPARPSPAAPAAAALPRLATNRPDLPGAPLSHYKVTFAGESGPLGSHVWPLDSGLGRSAREYVFLSVLPAGKDYDTLLARLEKETGFRYTGEKTTFSRNSRRTYLLGWAPYSSLDKIMRVKGVARASVERKSAGIPLKTKVTITLKVPFQNKPNAFVPEFVKTLGKNNNFDAETWFRLPERAADSRFSIFSVTGTLPVDMVGEVSRSPFVAGVEFKDASL